MTQAQFTDASGVTLDKDELIDIAINNARTNGELETLARSYLSSNMVETVQWATDKDGNFPLEGQE